MSAGELMPYDGVPALAMRLRPQTIMRRSRSGNVQVVRLGPAYWEFSVKTTPLTEDQYGSWLAFLDRREGPMTSFTAHPMPVGSPLGVDASNGAATVTSYNAQSKQIVLGNVGATSCLAGDMISYKTAAGGYYLGRITSNADANAGSITLTVTPEPVAPNVTPEVRLTNPIGEFVLSDMYDAPEGVEVRSVAFSAMQVIR